MILYDLICDQDHQYEAWFKDSATFDALKAAGHLTCEVCGSPNVSKAIMAPRLSTKVGAEKRAPREVAPVPHGNPGPQADVEASVPAAPTAPALPAAPQASAAAEKPVASLSAEDHKQMREIMRKVQDHIETNFDNVGENFAKEARAIQAGDVEDRGIYGQASMEDVAELAEDGIDVVPLPFGQKTHS